MREIKFRAWDKDDLSMHNVENLGIMGNTSIYGRKSNGSIERRWVHSDKLDIMQYIGKPDKNGKDIYEKDIVRQFADCDERGNDLYFMYLVHWNNEEMRFEGIEITNKGIVDYSETYCGSDLEDLEVIGNMYENPELIRGVKMNGERYIATANRIASDYYGLIEGNQYIVEQRGDGNNWVHDLHGDYITASRTDAFDDYQSLKRE